MTPRPTPARKRRELVSDRYDILEISSGLRVYGEFAYYNSATNDGQDTLRRHEIFICSHCGKQWGSRIWDTMEGYNRGPVRYRATMRECLPCGDGHLLEDRELTPDITESFESSLLTYELTTRLKNMEQHT